MKFQLFFLAIFRVSSTFSLLFPTNLLRLPSDENLKIVGGNATEIEKIPYIASLQRFNYHICGCNIISKNFVLTAAHCTYGGQASAFSVRFGSSFHATGGEIVGVKKFTQHKNFDYRTIDFDYSVIELVKPIEFSEVKQPILLPRESEEVGDGEMVVTSGWGNTQSVSETNSKLRTVEVPIVNLRACEEAYKGFGAVTPRMICAGFQKGGKDACQGDSGGPLAFYKKNEDGTSIPIIVGLTSWGYGCAKPNYPGVYSRVAFAADWIREITGIE